jgi:hypothetical protein
MKTDRIDIDDLHFRTMVIFVVIVVVIIQSAYWRHADKRDVAVLEHRIEQLEHPDAGAAQ